MGSTIGLECRVSFKDTPFGEKRINNPDDIMSMPYSIVATRQRYNIYAGNF